MASVYSSPLACGSRMWRKMKSLGPVRVEGVVDYGVGYGEGAHSVDGAHDGAVAGEVEEFAGAGQPAELLGAEVALDLAEHEAADLADVDPGREHGQRAGLSQLGEVVGYFEGGYFHSRIVPE